jgi:hypothetical protein
MRLQAPNGNQIEIPKCCFVFFYEENNDLFSYEFREGYDPAERYRFEKEMEKNFFGLDIMRSLSKTVIKKIESEFGTNIPFPKE